MNFALYISALTLGFLGSFHCAGMCGPLLFMLPRESESKIKILSGRFIYNSGRVFTYVFLGLLFGLLGLGAAIKGFQKELSIMTGIVILVIFILTLSVNRKIFLNSFLNPLTNTVRKGLKVLFNKKTNQSLFLIGILNGLLPCGFVYLALAGAVSTGSVEGGMIYMGLFGLGTFPMMMVISVAANFLGIKFRTIFSRVTPVLSIVLAIFLIYRGAMMKTSDCCKDKSMNLVKAECHP